MTKARLKYFKNKVLGPYPRRFKYQGQEVLGSRNPPFPFPTGEFSTLELRGGRCLSLRQISWKEGLRFGSCSVQSATRAASSPKFRLAGGDKSEGTCTGGSCMSCGSAIHAWLICEYKVSKISQRIMSQRA